MCARGGSNGNLGNSHIYEGFFCLGLPLPQPGWKWMPGESEGPSETSHPGDAPLCRFVLRGDIHKDMRFRVWTKPVFFRSI